VHVSELYVYPIKSLRGIALQSAQLEPRGIQHDRRWMLIDDDGVFISQREAHRMALIDVAITPKGLQVTAPDHGSITIPFMPEGGELSTRIWNDSVDAVLASRAANEWFSQFLGMSCRLVYMPESTERIVDPTYVDEKRIVGFADAFPLLIIGTGSLEELNNRLAKRGEQPLPMQRFRPNIVVAGTRAHDEDGWEQIRIGEVDIDVVKPCGRCAITTIDVATGEAGVEPLRTLNSYRKRGSKVMFGQNAVNRKLGTINVADVVSILTWRH
jgi:uncharacterized protein YcbX